MKFKFDTTMVIMQVKIIMPKTILAFLFCLLSHLTTAQDSCSVRHQFLISGGYPIIHSVNHDGDLTNKVGLISFGVSVERNNSRFISYSLGLNNSNVYYRTVYVQADPLGSEYGRFIRSAFEPYVLINGWFFARRNHCFQIGTGFQGYFGVNMRIENTDNIDRKNVSFGSLNQGIPINLKYSFSKKSEKRLWIQIYGCYYIFEPHTNLSINLIYCLKRKNNENGN
jgi:hypothetical protein